MANPRGPRPCDSYYRSQGAFDVCVAEWNQDKAELTLVDSDSGFAVQTTGRDSDDVVAYAFKVMQHVYPVDSC